MYLISLREKLVCGWVNIWRLRHTSPIFTPNKESTPIRPSTYNKLVPVCWLCFISPISGICGFLRLSVRLSASAAARWWCVDSQPTILTLSPDFRKFYLPVANQFPSLSTLKQIQSLGIITGCEVPPWWRKFTG